MSLSIPRPATPFCPGGRLDNQEDLLQSKGRSASSTINANDNQDDLSWIEQLGYRPETVSNLGHLSSKRIRRVGRIFRPAVARIEITGAREEGLEPLTPLTGAAPAPLFCSAPKPSCRRVQSGSTSTLSLSNQGSADVPLSPRGSTRLCIDGYDPSTSDACAEEYSLFGSQDDERSDRFTICSSGISEDTMGIGENAFVSPLTNHTCRYDSDLQASLDNYTITYSRHVWHEPISPKGHKQPGDWIWTARSATSPPRKEIEARLGRRFTFRVTFERGPPHHTTSRFRHHASAAREALKRKAASATSFFDRLQSRVHKRRSSTRPPPRLRWTPLTTPFVPGTLPTIPEFYKERYSTPTRAYVPEELPGFLEQSDSAMFHHNLLADTIHWGEQSANEDLYLRWCEWRQRDDKPAGSVPPGFSRYLSSWARMNAEENNHDEATLRTSIGSTY